MEMIQEFSSESRICTFVRQMNHVELTKLSLAIIFTHRLCGCSVFKVTIGNKGKCVNIVYIYKVTKCETFQHFICIGTFSQLWGVSASFNSYCDL